MDHAARLLAHGDLPVKAIATQVGYSTPYSFSAAFRRSRGCPPSVFRAKAAIDGG
jgi:AraC-like DNA-binding protein